MPYTLNKTNGNALPNVVQDAAIDQTTDLTFVGKNYAGYGEIQNENFLKLLENFANLTQPVKPILGQIWYNTNNGTLNVCYAEATNTVAAKFKTLATSNIALSAPTDAVVGDLWYDSSSGQLKVWSGAEFTLIGPPTGSDVKAQWKGDFEVDDASALPVYNIKAVLGTDEVVAILSAETYNMPEYTSSTPIYPVRTDDFTRIVKGITLTGADPITGSSRKEVTGLSTSSFFWGTAAESLVSLRAVSADASSGISAQVTTEDSWFYIPFINTLTNVAYRNSGITFNPNNGVLDSTASRARYADLAERYEANAYYEPGTVLMHGGEKEVTIATLHATTAVAGVVSKNPAYMMNSEAGSDETHPYIALKGRVPCKIVGPVKKGDLLVASGTHNGYATKKQEHDSSDAVIGKALQDFAGPFGVIEVKV